MELLLNTFRLVVKARAVPFTTSPPRRSLMMPLLMSPGVPVRAQVRLLYIVSLCGLVAFGTYSVFTRYSLLDLGASAPDLLVPISEWSPLRETAEEEPVKGWKPPLPDVVDVPVGSKDYNHPGTPPWQAEAEAAKKPILEVAHDHDNDEESAEPLPTRPQMLTLEQVHNLPLLPHPSFSNPQVPVKRPASQPWDSSTVRGARVLKLLSKERFPEELQDGSLAWKGTRPPPPIRWPDAKTLVKQDSLHDKPVDERDIYGLLSAAEGGRSVAEEDEWTRPSRSSWDPNESSYGKKRSSKISKIQFEGFGKSGWESRDDEIERHLRRDWVRRAFQHVWEGYKRFAWGHDELAPISGQTEDPFSGWGATLVDSLDTLLIMNMSHEYNLARTHVRAIDWSHTLNARDMLYRNQYSGSSDAHSHPSIPFFETNIRYVGGLLAAYDLSGDKLMLDRVDELAQWLLPAFGTLMGVPAGRYPMGTNPHAATTGRQVLAEIGSLSVEFTRLAQLTGKAHYFHAIQRITDTLDNDQLFSSSARLGSLLPTYVDFENPSRLSGVYSIGAMTDSYYEYLIKQYILLGGSLNQYSRMYIKAIDSARKYLITEVELHPEVMTSQGLMKAKTLTVVGDRTGPYYEPKIDHLTCFAGGMFALGGRTLRRQEDMITAAKVTDGCAWSYEATASGVGSEAVLLYDTNDKQRFRALRHKGKLYKQVKGDPFPGLKRGDARNLGRPETIESVFYMWRTTGDRQWQERGWRMFTSWIEASITDAGFANLVNVYEKEPMQLDKAESFVLAETFKYYYLLFSDPEVISLDDFVFNTEAHPMRIAKVSTSSRLFAQAPSAAIQPPYVWSGPEADIDRLYDPPHSLRGGKQSGWGTFMQMWDRVDPNLVTVDQVRAVVAPTPDWSDPDTREPGHDAVQGWDVKKGQVV